MAAETQDCRIAAFPTKNRTLFVTSATEGNIGPQDKFDYGAWYGDAFLEQCEGDGAEPARNRIVIFSFYKNPGPILTNSTSLFCKPSINIQRSTVTVNQFKVISRVEHSIPLKVPEHLTEQMTDAVRIAVDKIPNIEGTEVHGNNTRKYQFRSFVQLIHLS
jgi:hypothetical protein